MPYVSCRTVFRLESKFWMKLAFAKRSLVVIATEKFCACGTGIFFGFLLASTSVFAQTAISGPINTDAHWTLSNSPYVISGNVAVQNGTKLTVDPGVIIYMAANANLTVESGGIQAIGKSEQIIRVLSDKQRLGQVTSPGDWGQWKFGSGTTNTRLDYVQFENGKGLLIEGASPELNFVDLKNHQGSAISIDLTASPRGTGNKASGNEINGIVVPAGTIIGSARWGLLGIPYIVPSGTVSIGSSPTISSFSPNTLEVGESATFSVSGSRLNGLSNAKFDLPGLSAQVLGGATATQAQLQVTADSNAKPGSASLSLMADAGQSSLSNALTLLPIQPRINSVTPASILLGQGNVDIAVVGLNFDAQSLVYLDAAALTTTYVSNTELRAVVPSQATLGTRGVTVHTPSISGGSELISNGWLISFSEPRLALNPTDASIDSGSVKEFTISIPFVAPSEGLVVTLYSRDTEILTVPSSVTISSGKTSQTFNATGKQIGISSINASRAGFAGDTTNVSVVAPPSLTFPIANAVVVLNKGADLIVQSNRVAGSGGITVNLQSSNSAVASVPASISIPAGQKTVAVHVDGLSIGMATISATSSGFVASTVVVNVREQTISISKSLTNLAPTQTVDFNILLSDPAPVGGLVLNLALSAANRLTVAGIVNVPEGASSIAVTGQAQLPGSANLIVSANNFRTQTVPLSIDTVTLGWLPAGGINVVVGEQKKYAVTLSRALPFPLVLSPTILDTVAVVTPDTITIPAGQITSGPVITIEGRAEGAATLSLGVPVGFDGSAAPVLVGAASKLRFSLDPKKVPKGFSSGATSGVGGSITLFNPDGSIYVASQNISITLESGDTNKVQVPATVTVPKGQYAIGFGITGVDLTAPESPVFINASAPGFLSPDAKMAVEVFNPAFYFSGLETSRLLGERKRDAFGICVEGSYSNAIPINVDLTVQSVVPNIVDGLYYFQQRVTQVPIAGSCTYPVEIGYTQAVGTYQINGSVFGTQFLSSEVTVLAQPQLEFVASSYIAGTGLSGPNQVTVRRLLNGQPYAGSAPVTVTIAPADSTKVQLSQQSVTISAGSTQSNAVSLIGLTDGETTLTASAPGHTSGMPTRIQVASPYLKQGFSSIDQAVGDELYGWVDLRVPGIDYSSTSPSYLPAVDIEATLGFSNASPAGIVSGFYSAEDHLPITNLIFKAGSSTIKSFYVAPPVATGSYRITTKIGNGDATLSPLVRVWRPDLILAGSISLPLKVPKGYIDSLSILQRLNGQEYWRDTVISLSSSDLSKLEVQGQTYAEQKFTVSGVESTNGGVVSVTAIADGFNSLQFPVEVLNSQPILLTSGLHSKRSLYSGLNTFSVGRYLPGTTLDATGRPSTRALCSKENNPVTVSIAQANPANIVQLFNGDSYDCVQYYELNSPTALGSYQISASAPGMATYVSPTVIVGQPELGLSFTRVENELDSLRTLPNYEANYDGSNYLVSIKTGSGGKEVPAGIQAHLTCEPSTLCQADMPSVTISSVSRRASFNFFSGQAGSGVVRINAPGFASGTVPIVVYPAILNIDHGDPTYTPGQNAVWTLPKGRENWLDISALVPGGLNPIYQDLGRNRERGFSVSVSNPNVISVPINYESPSWGETRFNVRVDSIDSGAATLTISNPDYQPLIVPIVVQP